MAKASANSTPPWLSWMVLAFLLYAGYLHFVRKDDNAGGASGSSSPTAEGGTAMARQADTVANVPPGITIGGDIAGYGDPASCGQTASLDVSGHKPDGTSVDTATGTLLLPVGVAQDDKPWAVAVAGMKKGGVREVTLSAAQVYGKDKAKAHGLAEGDLLHYKIELKDLSPSAPAGSLPFRASDLSVGNGGIVHCGDRVRVHLDLWKEDGTLAYTTKAKEDGPIELTVGESANFYGLDRGLVNMRVGSVRNLIVPPAYLKASGGKPPAALTPLTQGRTLIADVQLLDIVDTSKKH